MTDFKKWTSINKFSDIFKLANKNGIAYGRFNAKIKLHGTNAAIRLVNQVDVQAQKRSSDIWPDNDNCGFARWVKDTFSGKRVAGEDGTIFYGEWAGKGVQTGDAVCQAPKTFYLFACRFPDGRTEYQPNLIFRHFEEVFPFFDDYVDGKVQIVPWHFDTDIIVNFIDHKKTENFYSAIVDEVDKISKKDPYIWDLWKEEGPGEGLVGYFTEMSYIDGNMVDKVYFNDYMFKVKSEAHSVQKVKDRKSIGVTKPDGVDDFVNMFVTDQRCEQMLNQIGGEPDQRRTGDFLKAIMTDIHKESKNELLAANLEFKDVAKYVQQAAKTWWFAKCNEF